MKCFLALILVCVVAVEGHPTGASYTEDRLYRAQRLIQESIGTCETRWRSEGMRNLAMVKNYIMSARDAYMDGNMNTYYYRMLRAHRLLRLAIGQYRGRWSRYDMGRLYDAEDFLLDNMEAYEDKYSNGYDPCGDWSSWGACSVTCGEGTRIRSRDYCEKVTEKKECHQNKCPAKKCINHGLAAIWKGNELADRIGDSKYGYFKHGAVSSSSVYCSRIGTEMLVKGGSAVDAGIATALCIGVINLQFSGIGGGHFMTVYDKKTGDKVSLMGREVAPYAATRAMFVNTSDASTVGGLAVGVPGEVRGFDEAHKRFGKLPWATLFAPSIKLAREGFPISWILHSVLKGRESVVKSTPSLRQLFVKPDGSMYEVDEILKRPRLANTLETIANEGADAFYTGSLAQDVVDDIKDYGGIITLRDLADYRADWVTPVTTMLQNGDYEVVSPPPPSSGVIVQLILKILDGYFMKGDNLKTKESRLQTYHRIIESFKFAYAKRSELGDARKFNLTKILNTIRSDDFAESRRMKIDDTRTHPMAYYEPGFENPTDGGTSHISVLAQDGSACSITSSVNLLFGAKRIGERTGMVLNNQMDDFSTPGSTNAFGFPASPSNYIEPGKRPMSSMSPSVVLNRRTGDVAMVIGGTGGSRIISGMANAAVHTLWLNKTLTEAANMFKLHHQLSGQLTYEEGFEKYVIDGLKAKGHDTKSQPFNRFQVLPGVVQAIHSKCVPSILGQSKACMEAVADWRKGGIPDGF